MEWDKQYWMEPWAKADMEYVVQRVSDTKKHRDAVLIYAGDEGTGKTTVATQHANYVSKRLDLPFGIENYYFSPKQLYDAVMKGDKPAGTTFVYDEGVTGLLAKTANSKDHIKLQILFSTCRSKRYPIFICIPRFRELPDWMSIDRSIALYKTYTKKTEKDPETIGFYKGYNKYNKRTLWLLEKAKKYLEIRKSVVGTQEGRFTGWPFTPLSKNPPFNYEEYESYKRKSLQSIDEAPKESEKGFLRRLVRKKIMNGQTDYQIKEELDETLVTRNHLNTLIREERNSLRKSDF